MGYTTPAKNARKKSQTKRPKIKHIKKIYIAALARTNPPNCPDFHPIEQYWVKALKEMKKNPTRILLPKKSTTVP